MNLGRALASTSPPDRFNYVEMARSEEYPDNFFELNAKIVRFALLDYSTDDRGARFYIVSAVKIIVTIPVLAFLVPSEFAACAATWYVGLAEFIDNLGISLSHVAGLVKAATFLLHANAIREMLRELDDDEFRYEDYGDFRPGATMQRFKKGSYAVTKAFGAACFTVFYSAYLGALFNFFFNQKSYHGRDAFGRPTYCAKLPFHSWIPFDRSTPLSCLGAMLFQHVLVFYLTMMILATDTLFVACVTCLTGHVTVLQGAFETAVDRARASGRAVESELEKCIGHYQKILQIRDKIETIYSLQIFAQVLITTLVTCTCLYLLSTMPFGRAFFVEVTYVAAIQLQLFMYCWYGNELTYASDKILYSLFESGWIDASKIFRNNLLFTSLRALKPLRITALKFTPLTLETLVMILRGSYSLFALLQKTQK